MKSINFAKKTDDFISIFLSKIIGSGLNGWNFHSDILIIMPNLLAEVYAWNEWGKLNSYSPHEFIYEKNVCVITFELAN